MTQILVTGAAGFIGSQLCEALLRAGYRVRGLDSFTTFYAPERKRSNLRHALGHPRFELVEADLMDGRLHEALDGIDAVAHLAGEPGVTPSWGSSFDRYVRRNVLASQRLLEALRGRGVQRFVYASSSSVYGSGSGGIGARRELRPASPYGVTKLAAETLVGAYAEHLGVSTVSLRYFSVYGPRQRPDMAAHRFIEALLDERPLVLCGDGMQVRDFTYVDDVVEGTIRALFADVPPATVLDIASGRPASVATLITCLRELVEPASALIEQVAERPGDVPRTEGWIADTCTLLDWSPTTDLRSGLSRQVRWHREERAERQVAGGAPVREGVHEVPTAVAR